jgi:hypothetical protein
LVKEPIVAVVGAEVVNGGGSGEKTAAGGENAVAEKKKKGKGKKNKGKRVPVVLVTVGKGAIDGVAGYIPAAERGTYGGEKKVDNAAEVQHDAGLGEDVAAADNYNNKKNPVVHQKMNAEHEDQAADQKPDNNNKSNDTRGLNYRADAGGSLRIPRQRFRKNKAARGSLMDVFKDQDQAIEE